MFDEGNPAIDDAAPVHFFDGKPVSWCIALHFDDAGIASGAQQIQDYDFAPEEPIASLLTDLGPLALNDLDAELGGVGTPGALFHAGVVSRPGAWFDWYRQIADPSQRSAAEFVEIKRGVRDSVLRALRAALGVN